jgi:hypothetical protein
MSQDQIRTAIERNVKAVTLRPSVGQGTAVTKATLRDGLTCDVQEGPWTLVAGMTEKYGGTNAGPNPGVYGRAALGSCLVLGYAMWAARLGVPLDALEVEVHASYDVRGELVYDSGDAAADAAFAGGPVAMAYARFDEATRAGARAAYIASIAQYRERDGYRIPGEFVISKASKGAKASK